MARKNPAKTTFPVVSETVRDPATGKLVTVRGLGALKDSSFKIRKDIDLTKPIAEQVFGKGRRAG